MKFGLLMTTFYTLITCAFAFDNAIADDLQIRELTDKIFVIEDSTTGDKQIVIASDKGLVVLNSFWSEITAQKFKTCIIENLERDDFFCLINTIDRLDYCGGNAAYDETRIIAHRAFLDKFKGHEEDVKAEVSRLIEMWQRKERVALERLPNHEPGSEQEIVEQKWITTCKQRAEGLEHGFSLVLPTETYDDRMDVNLGDITLNLIWFGRAGYDGLTLIVIPEKQLVILPSGKVLHSQHLAPHPDPRFAKLDVPRWIEILEELLQGENAVDQVLVGGDDVWSRERAQTHLNYIRKLWNDVTRAEAEGKDLGEIQEQFSLENDYAFVKEMTVYKENSDDWIRPQHNSHIMLFFLQHKILASEIISNAGLDSVSVALARISKLRQEGDSLYIEEASINATAYSLLGLERFTDAIGLFKLNVEVFPESFNAWDSYAEALMKSGDIENAILNYRKSLTLNPENDNAREMLQTLEKQ